MRNIFPDAGDLDIAVTEKGLEQLKQNYNLISKGNGFYIVTDNVECVCDGEIEKLEYKPELINGYLCQNIYEYLNYGGQVVLMILIEIGFRYKTQCELTTFTGIYRTGQNTGIWDRRY